jgi:hypothetical protein
MKRRELLPGFAICVQSRPTRAVPRTIWNAPGGKAKVTEGLMAQTHQH